MGPTTWVAVLSLTVLIPAGCAPAAAVSTSSSSGYSRAQFGRDYVDVDRDGCDTREELLTAPGPCPPHADNNITITDPYSGETVTGRTRIDVEHIIPLHWIWQHGANRWTMSRRVGFANDYDSADGVNNAILASSHQNRSKGDRGPSGWLPPDRSRWCWYADRWDRLFMEYQVVLPVTDPDAVTLTAIRRTC